MKTLLAQLKFLIPVILVLGGGAAYWAWHSHFGISKALRSNPILKRDYDTLRGEDSDTPVQQVAIALYRLNSYRLPEGQSEALKRVSDSRPQIRSAVAEALAMSGLKGESLEAMNRLVSDSDESVRVAALTALTKSADPKRSEVLAHARVNASKSPREELLIHGGLYGVTQGPEKEEHLKEILKALDSKADASGKSDNAAIAFALKTLLRMSPTDSASMDRLQAAFADPTTPKEMLPTLYRYLVRVRSDFLRKRFSQDVRSEFVALRVTALNSMLELCPSDRWSILQWLFSDPKVDPQSKTVARRVATYLGGKVATDGRLTLPEPGADRCSAGKDKSLRQAPAGKAR